MTEINNQLCNLAAATEAVEQRVGAAPLFSPEVVKYMEDFGVYVVKVKVYLSEQDTKDLNAEEWSQYVNCTVKMQAAADRIRSSLKAQLLRINHDLEAIDALTEDNGWTYFKAHRDTMSVSTEAGVLKRTARVVYAVENDPSNGVDGFKVFTDWVKSREDGIKFLRNDVKSTEIAAFVQAMTVAGQEVTLPPGIKQTTVEKVSITPKKTTKGK